MRSATLVICVITLLTSCLDSALDATDAISENRLIYLTPNENPVNYPNDEFKIIGIAPQGSQWNILVEYSGGCAEHAFYVWWDGQWAESYPAQASFWVLHNKNGEACEALVRDTLTLQMPLIFPQLFEAEPAHLTAINYYSQKEIEVNAYLAEIGQTANCETVVKSLPNDCGLGIWGQQWLLLKDSVPTFDEVWIQPVRATSEIWETSPQAGEYQAGLQLLFGFEFDPTNDSCEERGGVSVPAYIHCLNKMD